MSMELVLFLVVSSKTVSIFSVVFNFEVGTYFSIKLLKFVRVIKNILFTKNILLCF